MSDNAALLLKRRKQKLQLPPKSARIGIPSSASSSSYGTDSDYQYRSLDSIANKKMISSMSSSARCYHVSEKSENQSVSLPKIKTLVQIEQEEKLNQLKKLSNNNSGSADNRMMYEQNYMLSDYDEEAELRNQKEIAQKKKLEQLRKEKLEKERLEKEALKHKMAMEESKRKRLEQERAKIEAENQKKAALDKIRKEELEKERKILEEQRILEQKRIDEENRILAEKKRDEMNEKMVKLKERDERKKAERALRKKDELTKVNVFKEEKSDLVVAPVATANPRRREVVKEESQKINKQLEQEKQRILDRQQQELKDFEEKNKQAKLEEEKQKSLSISDSGDDESFNESKDTFPLDQAIKKLTDWGDDDDVLISNIKTTNSISKSIKKYRY